jgi:hypothetical protein
MHMLQGFAAGLITLLLISPAFGQAPPDGFRDLKWGATQEQVVLAFPRANCAARQSESCDWMCVLEDEKVNDVSVWLIVAGYTTGEVVGMSKVALSFSSYDVRRIVDAFESRYGQPSRVEDEEIVTEGGERFPNTAWRWSFQDSAISILQHSSRLGDAIASVALRSSLAEFQERTEQRKGGAGKGL